MSEEDNNEPEIQIEENVVEEDDDKEEVEDQDETSEETETPTTIIPNLNLKDMWERSFTFRIILTGGSCLFIALLLGFCMAISSSGFEADRTEYEKIESKKWVEIYEGCAKISNKQRETIKNLQEGIDNGRANIITLKQQIVELEVRRDNLTAEYNEVKAVLDKIRSEALPWQIATGVESLIGLGGLIYGLFNNANIKKTKLEAEEIRKNINLSKTRLRLTTLAATNYVYMESHNHKLQRELCFSSEVDHFNKEELKIKCTGHTGYLFIMKNDAETTFGVYISKALPENENFIEDKDAFVFITNQGIIAGIKDESKGHAFSFTADTKKMMVFGDNEIMISASSNDYTTVETKPGTSFEILKDSRLYHSDLKFKVNSLKVYKVTVHTS